MPRRTRTTPRRRGTTESGSLLAFNTSVLATAGRLAARRLASDTRRPSPEAITIIAAVSTRVRAEASLHRDLNLILQAVNGAIYELAATEGYFTTMLLLRYWPATRKIEMVRAGHLHPLLVSRTEVKELTHLKGVSLGVLEEVDYEIAELVLQPGESLLLFSDGVTEAENEQVEHFGYERLIAHLAASTAPPRGEGVLEAVRRWRGDAVVNDDLTIFEVWCELE